MRSTPSPRARRRRAIRQSDRSLGADVTIEGLTWRPARRRTPVLRDLDLHIPAGQRVLLAGPSGAGKSTLLRAVAGLLLTAAHGDLAGAVRIDEMPVETAVDRPALLLQDPGAAIVAETVGRDVAFGLENREVPSDAIWPRVEEALTATGFPYPQGHPTAALSGGETQRLALAGGLVLGSRVLLLDEPTSMLDPAATAAVHRAIRGLAADRLPTMVIVEHHLEPWLDFADRLVVLSRDGAVVADGSPRQLLAALGDSLARQGVWVPGLPAPELLLPPEALVCPWQAGPAEPVRAEGVWLERTGWLSRRGLPPVQALRGVDAVLRSGRALAVTGRSGAGKSSLVSVLAGLQTPTAGSVRAAPGLATSRGREPARWRSRDLASRLAWVPQSPEHGVVTGSVRDEVTVAARACNRDVAETKRRAAGLLEHFGLESVADASPYHLSGGEQRRLMLAAALVNGPLGLLLDEPTVGQDRLTWAAVTGALSTARTAGGALALATHDLQAVDAVADETLLLSDGVVVS